MGGYDLSFVNLRIKIDKMINHIDIFGFRIAFYGIIIGIGILLGLQLAIQDAKRRGENPDIYVDFAIYGIVSAILGARIYYVIFSWDLYKDNLLQVFNIRGGGLAIYGAIIGAALTLYIYCKKKKQSFISMADTAVLGLLVGQILGRWGNFFNMEAFGGYTNSLFAMQIKRELVNPAMISKELIEHIVYVGEVPYIQVHPTFLYESFWNLCVLCFLLWYRKRKRFTGEIFFIYIGAYGFGRAIIEGLRTDSLLIPNTNLAVSQLIGIACAVAAAVFIYIYSKKSKTKK